MYVHFPWKNQIKDGINSEITEFYMTNAKPKDWVNPRAWKPLRVPDCPVMGYLYRATTDGVAVIVQRKKYNHPDDFRTRKKLSMERWVELESTLENAGSYEIAVTLSKLARGTLK
jgi:hypothetical protein